jgi:hypothetical protein
MASIVVPSVAKNSISSNFTLINPLRLCDNKQDLSERAAETDIGAIAQLRS